MIGLFGPQGPFSWLRYVQNTILGSCLACTSPRITLLFVVVGTHAAFSQTMELFGTRSVQLRHGPQTSSHGAAPTHPVLACCPCAPPPHADLSTAAPPQAAPPLAHCMQQRVACCTCALPAGCGHIVGHEADICVLASFVTVHMWLRRNMHPSEVGVKPHASALCTLVKKIPASLADI